MTSAHESLRPKDAAKLLGVSVATFWRWLASKPDMPPARRLSKGVTVFDRGELLRWRDAQPGVSIDAKRAPGGNQHG